MNPHIEAAIKALEAEREQLAGMIASLKSIGGGGEGMIDRSPRPQIPDRAKRRGAKAAQRGLSKRARPKSLLDTVIPGPPAPTAIEHGNDNLAKRPAIDPADAKNPPPLSEAAIRIGATLHDPFSVTDLRARIDGEPNRAYWMVAAWKKKGWIEEIGFGQYRKSGEFGKR